jgi:hypothetical protein
LWPIYVHVFVSHQCIVICIILQIQSYWEKFICIAKDSNSTNQKVHTQKNSKEEKNINL